MNWQNKEGDIKQILENREFAFNPDDWEAAEKLLLLRKKRRKKRRLLIVLPLPVILLLALGVYYGTGTSPGNNFVAASDPGKTVEINTEKSTEKNIPGKEIPGNHPQINSPQAGNTAVSSAIADKNITDNSRKPNNLLSEKNNSITNTNESSAGEGDALVTAPGKKVEIKENNIPASPEEKENETADESQVGVDTGETPPADTKDTLGSPVIADEPEPDQEEKITRKEKEKTVPVVRNKIGTTVGGNYSRLLSVQRGKFAVLPYFAVNYGFIFNSKWQIGTGVAYSVLNGGGLQKHYSVSRHTFGETHTELTIQTTRLHYLEMPVTARYNFNDKLFFTGGISAGYLLGIKGSVDENSTGVFAKEPGYSKQASDYRGGLKPWDLQVQLGAEMRYKKQFYLGGLISGGMLDIGNNRYYNNTAFERNLRLQLYIRYELWNF
ncbi:MAG TPA: porin family protein [Bacteroidia bacterium]|nr:porin family protein [Bacteroidia bacterium]